MGNLDINPQVWLEELFECENCAECGKGAENHDAIPFLGNWFARCKEVQRTDIERECDECVAFCLTPYKKCQFGRF